MNISNADSPMVTVVDDDADVRRALSRLLRASGLTVQTFDSPQDFLEQFRPHPGCILLDLKMPKLSGVDLQAELSRRGIRTPIVFLTGHGDVPTTVRAMKGGAVDFLTKPFRARELMAAIQSAIAKDRRQRQTQGEREDIENRLASLTARELEVFRLVITGLLNKQIAAELGISERTVKVHRGRVMTKMQVVSVAELTRLAERAGISAPADSTPVADVGE